MVKFKFSVLVVFLFSGCGDKIVSPDSLKLQKEIESLLKEVFPVMLNFNLENWDVPYNDKSRYALQLNFQKDNTLIFNECLDGNFSTSTLEWSIEPMTSSSYWNEEGI
ncbi:MAG: hypothetical protein RIF34_09685, partial [Candidatus Kapaibacterium sp.]